MSRQMPVQKPGNSIQSYGTDPAFIRAVEKKFGKLAVDLAATADNTKAKRFVTPQEDSLKLPWSKKFAGKRCWLNPPFADIKKWAKKCADEKALIPYDQYFEILFLVPLSSSNWACEYCWESEYARVYPLKGRLTFEGETTPYPKDCMLVHYNSKDKQVEVWDWKASL